jgi:uncharacterized protein
MKLLPPALVSIAFASLTLVQALSAHAAPPDKPKASASAFREAKWEELTPKDWDPTKNFKNMGQYSLMSDADPKVLQMMREMRETWDNAPTVAAMDGQSIKLPGYVVPLEESNGALKEFLLVPYFGACIHTPPPPANQIVHVKVAKPVKFRSMDTVWISGVLKTARQDSYMGTSGYQVDAAIVEAYVPPKRP